MSQNITLDTNIVILYLQGVEIAKKRIDKLTRAGSLFNISTLTLSELLSFPKLSKSEEKAIFDFLNFVSLLNLDQTIAVEAGRLRRIHNLRLGDSIIAATALASASTLLTADKKDFQKIRHEIEAVFI